MLAKVKDAAGRKILFLLHALRQMLRPARFITAREVHQVVERGLIIEEYPNDPRGHSCLMIGYGLDSRPMHIVCAPKDDFLAVITAYLPDAEEWSEDFIKKDQAMKCIHCGGEMKPGTIPFHIDRKDCHVTLDKVPAWVCGQCGEAYFEEKEVIAIEDLVKALEDKAEALCVAG